MASISGSLSSAATGLVYVPPVFLSATGDSASVRSPIPAQFNVQVTGTFVATWQILRSIDGGKNFSPVSSLGVPYSFTGTMNESFSEVMQSVQYAIQITSYTSGALNYVFGP